MIDKNNLDETEYDAFGELVVLNVLNMHNLLNAFDELDDPDSFENLNPLILFINFNFSDCTAKGASVTSGLESRRKNVGAKKNAAVAELAVNQN